MRVPRIGLQRESSNPISAQNGSLIHQKLFALESNTTPKDIIRTWLQDGTSMTEKFVFFV